MYIVTTYSLAVFYCVITMLCWGSWANTQKLAGKTWRYELFYWDYVLGIFLFSLVFALTLGSFGNDGRGFFEDIRQVSPEYMWGAFWGGVIFNAANILLSTAIALVGMAVAFPVGIGLALVLGVIINYVAAQQGDPVLIFSGVGLIVLAMVSNALAYREKEKGTSTNPTKGLLIALLAGVLMSLFYRFVAAGIDLDNLSSPAAGKMTPYTAVVVFSLGIFASNFIFNSLLMRYPLKGPSVTYKQYAYGRFSWHLIGVLGGVIWALGNGLNFIAAGVAGPAISYGLGQGATLVSAIWGVFIWKEFRRPTPRVRIYLVAMFVLFVTGLLLLVVAGN